MQEKSIGLSVVIPVYDESESLPELMAWIQRVITKNEIGDSEIIIVDDGSSDQTWKVISELQRTYPQIKAMRFRRNYGKSAALQKGFEIGRAHV